MHHGKLPSWLSFLAACSWVSLLVPTLVSAQGNCVYTVTNTFRSCPFTIGESVCVPCPPQPCDALCRLRQALRLSPPPTPAPCIPALRCIRTDCTLALVGNASARCSNSCPPFGVRRLNIPFTCVLDKNPVVAPTATSAPTDTAEPTATDTPEPTATEAPAPTDTAEPTATEAPVEPFAKATKSGPIAITADDSRVIAVNVDTDTASLFEVQNDGTLEKTAELEVGDEPRSVALLPDGSKAYVANAVSGTVSVIDMDAEAVINTIPVGTEPWAIVSTPNGTRMYVANANSNDVSVIDTSSDTVTTTIPVGRSPRAAAISNDGDSDDDDETLFVPNFYARPRTGFAPPSSAQLGGTDGAGAAFPAGSNGQTIVGEGMFDDAREGKVDVISIASNSDIADVTLAPLTATGFAVARGNFVNSTPGDAPRTIFADAGTDGTTAQETGAFPNMLLSIAIANGRAYVPNSGASPEPPLRFNVNVQSLLSFFDTTSNTESGPALNMNRGINFDLPMGLLPAQVRDNTERMFPSAPVDIDCESNGVRCWVVSQGSDFVVKVDLDGAGVPTINAPTAPGPFPVSPVTRIFTIDPGDPLNSGRNPRGIVIDSDDSHAYVVAPTTRDVIVIDLAATSVMQRVRSADLPAGGSEAEMIRRGKIDFFTSRPFWSDRGWGGCWSCHPDGLTDTVTWSFENGPRQTISLNGTFSKIHGEDQRVLNWSGPRDENQDFELNTRGVFGGRGFITTGTDVNTDGITPDSDPNVRNFGPANTARSSQQEDITAFVRSIRGPIAPPSASGNVARGRDIFGGASPEGANCVACHSGDKWTTSRVTFDPAAVNPIPGTDTGIANAAGGVFINAFASAAGAGRICEVPPAPAAAQRIRILRQIGTFSATNPIEVRSNAISPVNTVDPALVVAAAFGGDGINAPTLIGVFESAPYFRHGAAQTLEEVFGIGTSANFLSAAQSHWRAGTGGAMNVLDMDPTAVTDLIAFVRTIDDTTTPFPAADLAPNDPVFPDAAAVCDCAKDPPVGTPVLDCTP